MRAGRGWLPRCTLTLSLSRLLLPGFDKYKGGLDTVHDLTGLYSVYTNWRSIEIMFHVSTQLPYEKNDPQKVRERGAARTAGGET